VGQANNPDGVHQITFGRTDGTPALVWTSDGRIVYTSNSGNNWDLSIVDTSGRSGQQLTTDAHYHGGSAVCGGSAIYDSDYTGVDHLYKMDLNSRGVSQFTDSAGERFPSCGNDGKWVVFQATDPDGATHLAKIPLAGGPAQTLSRKTDVGVIASSLDGSLVAHAYLRANNAVGVEILSVADGRQIGELAIPTTVDPVTVTLQWMPDGKTLAFTDVRSGASNIWAIPIAGGLPRQLTHFPSGQVWNFAFSPDGKSIAIVRGSLSSDVVLLTNPK